MMYEGYFDDSGTHGDSKVAVWGGLVGPAEEFDKLGRKWQAQLEAPAPGKSPIKQFKLSHCVNAWGEFEQYIPAERDIARRNFRDLIIDVDVAPLAHIVLVDDYLEVTTPIERRFLGEAQNFAFHGCLNSATKFVGADDASISCHFDQGQLGRGCESVLEAWRITTPGTPNKVSVTFSPVASLTGLQAADTIAYEAYQYGHHLIDPVEHPINPHFKDLTARHGALFFSLHKVEIERFLIPWRQMMRRLIR